MSDLGQVLAGLHSAGFDESSLDDDGDAVRVRCSQCDALVISRIPCHERGCPNAADVGCTRGDEADWGDE